MDFRSCLPFGPGHFDECDCRFTQEREDERAISDPGFLVVLAHGPVENVVEPIFNPPMAANQFFEALGGEAPRAFWRGHDVEVEFAFAGPRLGPSLFADDAPRNDLPCAGNLLNNRGGRWCRPQCSGDDVVSVFFPTPGIREFLSAGHDTTSGGGRQVRADCPSPGISRPGCFS